ncbi:MGMT family protein [Actinoallomurus acanthiterrae]
MSRESRRRRAHRVRLPIALTGTGVWRRPAATPYGRTVTYGAIAVDVGRARAARAVGTGP